MIECLGMNHISFPGYTFDKQWPNVRFLIYNRKSVFYPWINLRTLNKLQYCLGNMFPFSMMAEKYKSLSMIKLHIQFHYVSCTVLEELYSVAFTVSFKA